MAFDPVSYAMGTKGGGGSSGGGVLVVHESVEGTTHTLDKTWQEIHDADFAVLKQSDGSVYWTLGAVEDEWEYFVNFWAFGLNMPLAFAAVSASGYPAYEESPSL